MEIKRVFLPILFTVVIFTAVGVPQQTIKPRVAGLERDSVYMSLLAEEYNLLSTEDSLSTLLNAKRALFAADTANRAVRSNEILQLEGKLFDVRSSIGMVTGKTNTIEQEYIIANMGRSTPETAPAATAQPAVNAASLKNITDNPYVKANLSVSDFNLLKNSDETRAEIASLCKRFSENYSAVQRIGRQYQNVDTQAQSDSLYDRYTECMAQISRIEDSMKSVWGRALSDRMYIYALLLDKLNRMSDLDRLNEKQKNILEKVSKNPMSPVFAEYPARKGLLLEYEKSVAQALGMKAVVDSLGRETRGLDTLVLDVPKIELQQRDFVDYRNVRFADAPVYSTKNPIPRIEIPTEGRYYSVVIGTFWVQPTFATFKNAEPIYFEKIADGRLRFYVGLFRVYGDAIDAVNLLKEYGFKKPEVVEWNNGVYRNLAALMTSGQGVYRVEISGIEGELPDAVSAVVKRFGGGRDVVRVGDVFSVGVFTDKRQADELSEAMAAIGVTATTKPIEEVGGERAN